MSLPRLIVHVYSDRPPQTSSQLYTPADKPRMAPQWAINRNGTRMVTVKEFS